MPGSAEAIKLALNFHRAGELPRAEAIYRDVLQTEPNNPTALHYLGLIEQSRGRLELAAELMQRSVAVKPDQASAWNNLAGCLLEMDQIDSSIDAFHNALRLKPEYPMAWQNLARAAQRAGKVEESINASREQLKLQPSNPTAIWNIELCQRELAVTDTTPRRPSGDSANQRLSVIVTCYGDYPQYSVRCVESLASTPGLPDRCDVHVGCNTCSPRTLSTLRAHLDAGRITSLIESNRNVNKDPMIRANLGLTRSDYVLMMDDDSHVHPGWLEAMYAFIARYHPFDVAGEIYTFDRIPRYQQMVESKPWWKSRESGHPAYRDAVFFATGGMILARVEFLRQYDFPDPLMIIWRDDVMLSDLINQVGGRLLRFSKSVMDFVKINDGQTRGEDIAKVVSASGEEVPD